MQLLKPTHPDAELHVFSAVNFHAFVEQANLLKVLSIDHKAANQSGAPGIKGEGRKRVEVREVKDVLYKAQQSGSVTHEHSPKPQLGLTTRPRRLIF